MRRLLLARKLYVIRARVPVLKFFGSDEEVLCDVSVNNHEGLQTHDPSPAACVWCYNLVPPEMCPAGGRYLGAWGQCAGRRYVDGFSLACQSDEYGYLMIILGLIPEASEESVLSPESTVSNLIESARLVGTGDSGIGQDNSNVFPLRTSVWVLTWVELDYGVDATRPPACHQTQRLLYCCCFCCWLCLSSTTSSSYFCCDCY